MKPESLIWQTPSRDSSGSMPLGNGDIGLNVWVEKNGDLLFYIGKTDAWDESGQLLKLGRIRVSMTPNPFVEGATFRQELDLASGCIRIQSAINNQQTSIQVWVDANRPVICVALAGDRPYAVRVAVEHWRPSEKILADTGDAVVWCHRNATSCWKATLEQQDVDEWVRQGRDPLLNRTFGALLRGERLVKDGEASVRTAAPQTKTVFRIHPLTAQTDTLDEWEAALKAQAAGSDAVPLTTAFAEHVDWWRAFWERSWIHVSGSPEAETVSRGYALQRFVTACGGRGAFPIKFNGSIFTVDAREGSRDGYGDENQSADYRRWGGCYWFQNTRLAYWPMIASGDYDLMQPWFRMYLAALPFAMARAKANFGLDDAAMFTETMHFWGAYRNGDYGTERGDLPPGVAKNPYVRRYWQGGLELLAVLLEAYATEGDEALLRDSLLVLAGPILRFYKGFYTGRDEAGKMRLAPAQSLETWMDVVNPLPDIAGLHWVLAGLLALPADKLSGVLREEWEALQAILPPVPTRTYMGKRKRLIPALQYDGCNNCENPELYAVFPYRLAVLGTSEHDAGCEAFRERLFKRSGGWHQDAIQAALLGLTEDAKREVVHNFGAPHAGSRFPGFWGPNYDWIPDQDHGGVACIALQRMLMQCDLPATAVSGEARGSKIHLLPSWPREWNVSFRLHAPGKTVVEGCVEQGVLRAFRIEPEERREDVEVTEYNDPVAWRLSDVVARPEGGVAEAPWRGCENGWGVVKPDANGFVNVRGGGDERDGMVYLANRFDAPFEGLWRLSLGHDGGARVFVDGTVVLSVPEARNPARPGRSTADIRLSPGAHEVVIAFDLAAGAGWGVFFAWIVPEGEQAHAVQRRYPVWCEG